MDEQKKARKLATLEEEYENKKAHMLRRYEEGKGCLIRFRLNAKELARGTELAEKYTEGNLSRWIRISMQRDLEAEKKPTSQFW